MPNRFRETRWKPDAQRPPFRRLLKAERTHAESQRQLQAALDLNHLIAEASAGVLDEHGLMDGALAVITRLVGALGCSFVPVDEWQQPLPPFTHGELPAPVMSAWSTRLASGHLRERCGSCAVWHSTPGGCPLHPHEVGDALQVYCLPLNQEAMPVDQSIRDPRTGRPLGVLHLYLPDGRVLTENRRDFIARVLPDIAQAYQAARLRSQEAATMRQINLVNDPESDFLVTLNGLLEGLRGALEADFVLLRLRPSAGERMAGLHLRRGNSQLAQERGWDAFAEGALESALRDGLAFSPPGSLPAWVAVRLPEPSALESRDAKAAPVQPAPAQQRGSRGLPANGKALQPHSARLQGILLVGADRPRSFHSRQQVILRTIASQAALLVSFEQRFRSLEYSAVIQERARLAREIHDGLAQTLAFLKLQAAQMQSQLAQGEFERLAQVLKDSYQVLSEAYLDTRQAIDDLRLTPQDTLDRWIERVIGEFERGVGYKVERKIQPLARPVPQEMQVQLVRIVQEALSNIRKHAHARHVHVCLCEEKGSLVLEVIDDGQGFEAADVPDDSRHGLRGMRERAEMIGADFHIISRQRQGTTMRLALPLWAEQEQSA